MQGVTQTGAVQDTWHGPVSYTQEADQQEQQYVHSSRPQAVHSSRQSRPQLAV